jgi:hypothetical protein
MIGFPAMESESKFIGVPSDPASMQCGAMSPTESESNGFDLGEGAFAISKGY